MVRILLSSTIFVVSLLSRTTQAAMSEEVPLNMAPPQLPIPLIHRIHPGTHFNKCLDVRGGVFENGTPVQIFDCNGTPAQDWIINRGPTRVRVAGKNFCLDAGEPPFTNGRKMKIWECVNVAAQEWFYTNDNRIALEGQGTCLDLSDGKLENSNPVQIWKCTDRDDNQVWTSTL